MEIWQSAVKMLKDPVQREAIEKLYIDYVPDKGTVSFPAEKTGIDKEISKWIKNERAGTETGLGWHLSITNRGQLIAVAHNVTKFKLTLRGKIGWENGVELLQKYGQMCYSNDRLQATGICLTKERYEDLSGWLKSTTKVSYWLADRRSGRQDSELLGMLRVDVGTVTKHILHWVDTECSVQLAIRPSVYLSLDTLLDMGDEYYDGSSPARAIKMRVGDLKEEQSLELERQHYKRYARNYLYSYSRSWETIRTKLN